MAREHRPLRRGDNIPPVSDYAHYNEEAEIIWYLENRYDMEHADEIIEEELDDYDDLEGGPEQHMDGEELEELEHGS